MNTYYVYNILFHLTFLPLDESDNASASHNSTVYVDDKMQMCSRGLHRSRKSRLKEGLIRTCIFQIENQSIVIPGFLPFPTSTCACVPFFCSITYLLDCSWTSIDIRLTMHCNAFLISQWCLLLILILFVKSKCLLYCLHHLCSTLEQR